MYINKSLIRKRIEYQLVTMSILCSFSNHFGSLEAHILCQIQSNLPRHSWHSTDFSWLKFSANAVGWRAGKSLMKILSRTRHLPIAENCAQIISILKRNHWNLSISAGTPTTADAGRHDDAVTDIRPDGATLWNVKIKYLWYFWAQFLAFGKSKLQIFIWHRLSFAFALALPFFQLVLYPRIYVRAFWKIQFNFHFSCTGCGISYEFLRMLTGRVDASNAPLAYFVSYGSKFEGGAFAAFASFAASCML